MIAEGLQTCNLRKLGKILKISNISGGRAYYPVSLPEIKLWYT